jgi:anti-anti-sigma factor
MQHHLESKILTVVVPGDILSTNAEELRSDLVVLLESPQCAQGQCATLRLDLTHARMIDSVGLNLLVTFIRFMKERGGKVQAVVTNPNIERTFIFTRLDQMLEVIKPSATPPSPAGRS